MDESKLRREVRRLDSERKTLLLRVLRPGRMIKGSLYRLGRSCGNPNCKCARGEKHFSWYLSLKIEGKTRLTYIGRVVPADIDERVKRYQHHQRILARIRRIDVRISDHLNQLRDEKLETIDKDGEK